MRVIADLHIHSKYSRACSPQLTLENLEKYAKIKGLNLLGTGDFTHPLWLKELKKLKEEKGLHYLNNFPFVLTGEISLIYTDLKCRKVHLVLLVPSIEIVEKINSYLDTKGRRDYDGRPIFKISCEEFTKKMMEISKDIEIIPAHSWTPYFGVFGSMSGFNYLKEAFKEQEANIHAIETGMSSDPEMNWHISDLNNKTIVSFSDAHSFWPWRLGREATIFSKINSYKDIIEQIRKNEILGTIETDPAYGKYHYDGHRLCKFSCSPQESKKLNNICPVCKKPLTIGVENRVEELTNQDIEKHKHRKPYYKLLPLHELIALVEASTLASKKTWAIYDEMIKNFGNELSILLDASESELLESFSKYKELIHLILKNREGKIKIKPGYDGEYGTPLLGNEISTTKKQKKLSEF